MALVPADWEPLNHEVGPFGPGELEIREAPASRSRDRRTWYVRVAARRDVVAEGMASSLPWQIRNLSDIEEVKRAVADSLRSLVPGSVDKGKVGSLPWAFRF